MAQAFVDAEIADNKVVVFSKTYCPYCRMAKDSLNQTGVKFVTIELDERGVGCIHSTPEHVTTCCHVVFLNPDDGASIQDYLLSLTGARSVPRVFIGGESVGGGTDVKALQDQGKLVPKLKECGAL